MATHCVTSDSFVSFSKTVLLKEVRPGGHSRKCRSAKAYDQVLYSSRWPPYLLFSIKPTIWSWVNPEPFKTRKFRCWGVFSPIKPFVRGRYCWRGTLLKLPWKKTDKLGRHVWWPTTATSQGGSIELKLHGKSGKRTRWKQPRFSWHSIRHIYGSKYEYYIY